VLWVGAGASAAAGYPGTSQLVRAMLEAAEDPIDADLSFFEVADAFVASQGAGDLGGRHAISGGGWRIGTVGVSPLRGWGGFWGPDPGLAPGLNSVAASRLEDRGSSRRRPADSRGIVLTRVQFPS
jgi:hypothetical protein